MSTTAKSLEEKIAIKDEKIQQLLNQKKQLRQKHNAMERKERNSRLFRRHGLLEKYMPSLITLTDEQFEMFIKRGVDTSYGNKILDEISTQTEQNTPLAHAELNHASDMGSGANLPKGSQSEA